MNANDLIVHAGEAVTLDDVLADQPGAPNGPGFVSLLLPRGLHGREDRQAAPAGPAPRRAGQALVYAFLKRQPYIMRP